MTLSTTLSAALALFAQVGKNANNEAGGGANQIGTVSIIIIVVALVAALIFIVFLFLFFSFIRLWIQALLTEAEIGIVNLIGMKLRNVDYAMIVRQKIALVQAGVKVTTDDLESHFLARGNVPKTATAVIAAHKAGLDLPWRTAAAIDLAGRDVLEAVRTSVNPKVIDCPDPAKGKQFLDAVCRNGIQLLAKARVTVRTKLERLVGGATEETIIARVGEGIVKAIGSAHDHKEVLANPGMISQTVLHNALDAQTAFEIVSIDIAHIEVGENIGAKLQADQAAADLRVAQAEAEKRRAAAVAREQEMRALVEENRAKVVEAEAEVPLAIADAFQNGQLGRDGLLQHEERAVRHADAEQHRHHDRRRRRAERLRPVAGGELRGTGLQTGESFTLGLGLRFQGKRFTGLETGATRTKRVARRSRRCSTAKSRFASARPSARKNSKASSRRRSIASGVWTSSRAGSSRCGAGGFRPRSPQRRSPGGSPRGARPASGSWTSTTRSARRRCAG